MTQVDAIVAAVKEATDYQTNKRILTEKMQAELHLPYNSGLFYVDMALISFLSQSPDKDIYITDIYQNPILVDRYELLLLARERYNAVMNSWNDQYTKLKQTRRV
jgi:hypothetical protein